MKNIKTFFDHQEQYFYKPIRVGNFWNNNYIEYQSKVDRNKNLLITEYLDEIKPYLKKVIIYLQKPDTWKIQLTKTINFICSKDTDEEHVMHSKSDKIEVTTLHDANEVAEELFESLLSRYQISLETTMRGSGFIFDCVNLMYCKCHKIDFKRGSSDIDSLNWIKNLKKPTINPKNGHNRCFQYAATIVLGCKDIAKNPQRIMKLYPFINKYNWYGINFPSEKNNWEKFEKNNSKIVLIVLYEKENKTYTG